MQEEVDRRVDEHEVIHGLEDASHDEEHCLHAACHYPIIGVHEPADEASIREPALEAVGVHR